MSNRNVVVAMPFGSPGPQRRKAILNFRRIKYIIEERCQVVPTPSRKTGERLDYDVDVARTRVDDIPTVALDRIYKADILIVLLSGRNPTVTYELGFRRARASRTSVILIGDSKDDLPVYESSVAYQSWTQEDVLRHIDSIAEREFPRLNDFGADIPDELKEVIDARDGELINGLQVALQEIESNFVAPCADPVQKLRGMLSENIARFYPFSVVEVKFSDRGVFEDPSTPAEVLDFDEEFSRLFGYASRLDAEADGPLTLNRLLGRLEQFSDPDDWKQFLFEQEELTETVVRRYGYARTSVPLKINHRHPDERFRSKSFLPCMAAKVVDSDHSGPHRMYLLVAYIELKNGTPCPLDEGEE